MLDRTGRKPRAVPSGRTGAGSAALVPCVLLRKGEICLPSAEGPVPARDADGGRFDPFDVVDRLVPDYPLVYLVDLDGIERAEPQLDFLQELARDATLWVDGGVRNAEQAIDILVTGAQRAVLSSATLQGARELRRAWKLSSELVFEVEVDAHGLVAAAPWETTDPIALSGAVRSVGVDHLVLSPREIDPDWSLVRTLAAGGPTWVNGSFEPSARDRLEASGARGGIFHIDRILGVSPSPRTDSLPLPSKTSRDDET